LKILVSVVRFRPGPPSETEKTPAFSLGFLLLWFGSRRGYCSRD
jgi:hypothetical protein